MSHGHSHGNEAGGCCGSGHGHAHGQQAQPASAPAPAPVTISAPLGALGIALTPKAIAKAKAFIAESGVANHALRVSVVGGGCSGLSYRLELDDQVAETDRTADYDGLKVVSDAKSIMFLTGTEIDFAEGLQGSGFTFKNPNAKGGCGCGSSFSA
jgi:iron-sulfur cluster assembly protein